jgi:metallo-beta-lactamase class B
MAKSKVAGMARAAVGIAFASAVLTCAAGTRLPVVSGTPKVCKQCATWNAPQEPFKVFGNTYYVGVAGLSSILVASGDGLILLDGGLPQSAPLIAANIRKLGFRVEDIRLIVNSHTHYDHAGGIAALKRASGAAVAASPAAALALERGGPTADDPQYAFGRGNNGFPAVPHVRVVADNQTLHLGQLAVTAHFTPGHTPGGTTWTWRACEGSRCLDVVYADSLTAISAPEFRFTGNSVRPGRVESFRRSIALVASLPCDILLTPHPEFFMEPKLKRAHEDASADPFVDAQACKAYAAKAGRGLEQRIVEENSPGGVQTR